MSKIMNTTKIFNTFSIFFIVGRRCCNPTTFLSTPVGLGEREVPGTWDAILACEIDIIKPLETSQSHPISCRHELRLQQMPLTWKHRFNVPGHDGVEHGVEEHEWDGGGEAVGVLLHGAGEKVTPLYSHSLLLEQSEVLAAEAERHRRQEALRRDGQRSGQTHTHSTGHGFKINVK